MQEFCRVRVQLKIAFGRASYTGYYPRAHINLGFCLSHFRERRNRDISYPLMHFTFLSIFPTVNKIFNMRFAPILVLSLVSSAAPLSSRRMGHRAKR